MYSEPHKYSLLFVEYGHLFRDTICFLCHGPLLYMLFCVCCHSFRKIICFFYVLSHSSIRYFLYTGSYSPMLFLMSWAMTISCTHSMWAFTLPDTICFLSPETQQYIRYSLYAQVLIPRHNTVCFLCPETQQHIRYSL